MADWLTSLISSIAILLAGYFIFKKYQTHAVLLITGFFLSTLAMLSGRITSFVSTSTGTPLFDLFKIASDEFVSRAGGIGLIIMTAAGFSVYMGTIGAADTLVRLSIKPLQKIKQRYLLLGMAYFVGQLLNIVIPSATGLSMLLLVAMYPVLIALKCSPAASVAVIATASALDLGPASGNTNRAAELASMDSAVYFAQIQLPASLITMIAVAIVHIFVQRFFDRRESNDNQEGTKINKVLKERPAIYALLPIMPILLLLIFSKLVFKSIKLDVVTAMLFCVFVSIIFECIRTKNLKSSLKGFTIFFQGMSSSFSIVALLVSAGVFIKGLRNIGFIDILLSSVNEVGLPFSLTIAFLVAIIGFTAFVTGSGNAAFFSFSDLTPRIAMQYGREISAVVCPTQLASGIFRSMSPVSGVVIVCAETAGISTFTLAKRTAIPMLAAALVSLVASLILAA